MIILVFNNIIIDISDTYEIKENGYLINGRIYPEGLIYTVSLSEEVVPQKYCYTPEKGVYLNQRWLQLSSESRIGQLEEVVNTILGGETV